MPNTGGPPRKGEKEEASLRQGASRDQEAPAHGDYIFTMDSNAVFPVHRKYAVIRAVDRHGISDRRVFFASLFLKLVHGTL